MLIILLLLYFTGGGIIASPAPYLFARSASIPTLVDQATCVCPAHQRSLAEIIWSCLATIFACSWVAIHPNIPHPDAPWWRPALTRLELMAWTIIAPELMIFWAMRQWYGARDMQEEMQSVYPGWTSTHGYFLQMGGFMLYDGEVCKGVLGYGAVTDNIDLGYLLRSKMAQTVFVSRKEIEDRSKADAFSKTIVLGQTTWFVTQCISRRAQDLATTELELVTLAFAVLTGFMYFFWWDKPLDVRTSVPVYLVSTGAKDPVVERPPGQIFETEAFIEEETLLQEPSAISTEIFNKLSVNVAYTYPRDAVMAVYQRLLDMSVFTNKRQSEIIEEGDKRVHTFYAIMTSSFAQANTMQVVVSIIGVLFGAIHCAGWNFEFPSTADLIMWRVSSLLVTAVPLLMVVRYFLFEPFFSDEAYKFTNRVILNKFVWPITVYIGLPLYMLSRIILLVLACLALRDLSPSALAIVQWSSFLPHI